MGFQESTGFCQACDRQVMVRRKTANHVLHFLLTVFFGWITIPLLCIGGLFWLMIWVMSSIRFGGWRCTVCGLKAKHGVHRSAAVQKKQAEPIETTQPTEAAKTSPKQPEKDDDDRPNVYVIE